MVVLLPMLVPAVLQQVVVVVLPLVVRQLRRLRDEEVPEGLARLQQLGYGLAVDRAR